MTIHQVPKNFNPEAEPNWVRLIRMFITGEYPDTYLGKRFEGPTRGRIMVDRFVPHGEHIIHHELADLPGWEINGPDPGFWEVYRMKQRIPVRFKYKENGSTFNLLAVQQDSHAYEGWDGHWAVLLQERISPHDRSYKVLVHGLMSHDGVIMV